MINNAFGLIFSGNDFSSMKELCTERTLDAIPFGGRYRAIDFALSNLVNTGVTNVGIITQRKYNSLMDHVGGGAPWDLHRKRDGLFLLPPYFVKDNTGNYSGTVDAFQGAMNYIAKAPYEYCIVINSSTIFNTSFEDVMQRHVETGADITYFYNIESLDQPAPEMGSDVRFIMNEYGRIVDMEMGTTHPKSQFRSMNCMIMSKSTMEYLLDEATGRGAKDFSRDIVYNKLDTLKVYGYRYDDHVVRLESVSSYFQENLKLLDEEIRADLFSQETPIYTKVKDEPPTRYAPGAVVKNSLISDGCNIEGTVENCILFRGVRVAKGAKISNCVIMQGSEISENAELENVILDKGVLIRRDRRLLGTENFPVIIRKNAVV